ncbi:non-ribosomal peptide synthetase [Trichoderma citrinoviride]|uniref:Non-ribosomal peptide synthetase n=1 Tax=Trichoderma citrinoviride TaxID=58853 RepID=A0A2T4AXQ0_9HYPO|nr:non-ribosomal peptide synthetase [Trichoderma citrinoviride]PTB61731.1 non-ribosomal peptide synthetase [Trichoderma citrinoviride]
MTVAIGTAGKGPRTVCDLIEDWAQKQPDHIALSFGDRSITYAELENATTYIAWMLCERQVKPGDKIPVLAQRSLEMVICFLGVLKAGALYVPIDVESWSKDRINSTMERVSARIILNTSTEKFPGYEEIPLQDIKRAFEPTMERQWQNELDKPWKQIKPSDLMFIIFTSGTTSTPKGVMIPHSSVFNYVQQGGKKTPFNLDASPADIVILIFSPAFDACTAVILSTLCNGAELKIATPADYLHTATLCTIMACTPSVLATIQDPSSYSNLRAIMIGGEAAPASLVCKWGEHLPNTPMYNFYGPTETTFASLVARLYPNKPITLGYPMSNSCIRLLDGDVESRYGEICISGPGLATGYFENEALTAEKFVYWEGERMYRTGDFARMTEYGLEFAGRKDSVVKNRGFLVNLDGQVIPMLNSSPNVISATAFMHRGRLVAFVTPETVNGVALRKSLIDKYDSFIIPDVIRSVEALPLNANDKIDNRALQALLDIEDSQVLSGGLVPELSDHGTKMDILKAAISFATSLPLSDLPDSSSFTELGGNSLAGIKVVSFLRTMGLHLRLGPLFDLPSLSAIHDAVESLEDTEEEEASLEQGSAPSIGPMTSLQKKMVRTGLRSSATSYMLVRLSLPHKNKAFKGDVLQSAWRRVIERHSIFRTVFSLEDQLQRVQPTLNLDWINEETTEDQLETLVQVRSEEMRKRINYLEHGDTFTPISAYRLMTVPYVASTFLALVHHSLVDGWSFSIILEELCLALDGKHLPEPPQFMNIALAQVRLQRDAQGNEFWAKLLKDGLSQPLLRLPEPSRDTVAPDWSSSLQLSLGFGPKELETKGRLRGVTPATAIYTAWGLVLSSYSFSDQVAFGAVFSGRNIDVLGADRVVGPLLNTCPFPLEFKEGQSVTDALSTVQSQLLQMLEFQWCADNAMARIPAEKIANAFQTVVVIEYGLPPLSQLCETLPEPWTTERQDMMEFGITLLLEEDSDANLRARILYDSSQYTEWSIAGLLKHFYYALRGLLDPDNALLQHVRDGIVIGEERTNLLKQPQEIEKKYPGYDTVKDAFEAAAAKWPELVALESTKGSMTYRQLDDAANQLACHLRSVTSPEDVVGILTDGSLHWIVAILSVLKAGCICCPIDVSLPTARIEVIIEQSGAAFFVAASRGCVRLPKHVPNNRIIVSEEFHASRETPALTLETISKPSDVIYLVFTSGSTGIPKGVALHNHSLIGVINHEPNRLFSGPGRRLGQVYALGFDVVLVEIFGTLLYGGTLVLKDPSDPLSHLKRVDAIYSTPSLLVALSPNEYSNLDTIGLAGEAVSQSLANAWSHTRLFNFYGPSECGPISTGTDLLPGHQVTIGKPVPNLELYLLDHHQCPVPIGVTGEIYISGEQVTHGYWNSPSETRRAFLPNPFFPGKTMYKTGDLGYWTQEMKVVFVGRIDSQVKIRGFRIEMEEVERAITAAHRGVQNAAAIVDQNRIVAFVTPNTVDTDTLRQEVRGLLPVYACPARIVALDTLPQSSNFKIDRTALQTLAAGAQDQGDDPSTPTEKMVAEIWIQVLGLHTNNKKRRITRDADFLAIGGNSLLAIKAARLISESTSHRTPVPLLMREVVLSNLAQAIDQYMTHEEPEESIQSFESILSNLPVPASLTAAQTPSPLEEELFLWQTISNTKSLFNTAFQFVIEGHVNIGMLTDALVSVIREEPILRARYVLEEGLLHRYISDQVTTPLVFVGKSLDTAKLQSLIEEPFDLARDQLIRAVIWKQDDGHLTAKTLLSLITHHIITDKASLAILLESIGKRYTAAVDSVTTNGQNAAESTPKGTYIEWTQWLAKISALPATPATLAKQKFWHGRVREMEAVPLLDKNGRENLGRDVPCYESLLVATGDGCSFSQRMALAAAAITLFAVFGEDEFIFGIPYMNRDEPGTANLMGLLLDRLPVHIKLHKSNLSDSARFIDDIVSEVNHCVQNQMPYMQILRMAKERRPLFDVVVIYHWKSDALEHSLRLPGTQVSSQRIRARGAKFTLQLEFTEQDEGLHCGIEYNARALSAPQMAAIISFIPSVIKGLMAGSAPAKILSYFSQSEHCNPLEAMPAYRKRTRKVREAFSEALGVHPAGIALDTTLYDLGGTSATALRLQYSLKKRGMLGNLGDILLAPSVGSIAWMFS